MYRGACPSGWLRQTRRQCIPVGACPKGHKPAPSMARGALNRRGPIGVPDFAFDSVTEACWSSLRVQVNRGHSRTRKTGQKRSFKNAATASQKRPLLALVPDHQSGCDFQHPLQISRSGSSFGRLTTQSAHAPLCNLPEPGCIDDPQRPVSLLDQASLFEAPQNLQQGRPRDVDQRCEFILSDGN